MSLVKLPKKSVEFFKKNQDEILNSGNLVEGAWNKTLNEKIKEIIIIKFFLKKIISMKIMVHF